MEPLVALYWKTPPCAPALRTLAVVALAVAVMLDGCLDSAKVPKKNSLFFQMGPPMLPPKSFSLTMFRGRPRALLSQELEFKRVLWKSSKRRPWKALLPRLVTMLIFMAAVPLPVRSNWAV